MTASTRVATIVGAALLVLVAIGPVPAFAAECEGLPATIEGTPGDDLLDGTDGNDVIVGLGGNDVISGLGGNDVICGNAGDDWVRGGGDNDTMVGGAGTDTISLEDHWRLEVSLPTDSFGGTSFRGFENLIGSPFDDVIFGDAGDNHIEGGDGQDEIHGGAGNDTLIGGAQRDQLMGEDGDDLLLGQSHGDTLAPGLGDDEVRGGAANDVVSYFDVDVPVTIDLRAKVVTGAGSDLLRGIEHATGGGADDVIHGTHGANTLRGGDGNDLLIGYRGLDVLIGGAGHDHLEGRDGADTLRGGTGHDLIIGGGGGDYVQGDKGDDILEGSAGPDRIIGGDGDDLLDGGTGGDDLDAGTGDDIVLPGPGSDSASAGHSADTDLVSYFDARKPIRVDGGDVSGSGTDVIFGFDWVEDTEFDDRIERAGSAYFGLGGNDVLTGWASSSIQIFAPGSGNDRIDGGGGYNYVTYYDASSEVTVDLADGSASGAGLDRLVGIQGVEGSSYADTLRGDSGANGIYGLAGDDTLVGRDGDDYLDGGDGDDTLDGGAGVDECVSGESMVSCETVDEAAMHTRWHLVRTRHPVSPAIRLLRENGMPRDRQGDFRPVAATRVDRLIR